MAVSLQKGGRVSLTKEAPGLESVLVGLGWDARSTDGKDFDLDASAFLLGEDGKVVSDRGFVFYNNSESDDGSVRYMGDNLTGEGSGDDEVIRVALSKVPSSVVRILIAVTIHDAGDAGQTFGQVENAFARVVNESDDVEIARYDLSEDASGETALVFAELYRKDDGWSFKAVGAGYAGGLAALGEQYGVTMA